MFEIILIARPILLALESKNDVVSQINTFLEHNIRCCEEMKEKVKVSCHRKGNLIF